MLGGFQLLPTRWSCPAGHDGAAIQREMKALTSPIVNDRVLMSLLRIRSVPLGSLIEKCDLEVNKDNALKVIQALNNAEREYEAASILNLNIRYLLHKRVLFATTGELGTNADRAMDGPNAIAQIIDDKIKVGIGMQAAMDEFRDKAYSKLSSDLALYESVVSACRSSANIDAALDQVGMSKDDWKRLRLTIARHGLKTDDILFSESVELHGSLVRLLKVHATKTKPIDSVVHQLVRSGLDDKAPKLAASVETAPELPSGSDPKLREAHSKYEAFLRDAERVTDLEAVLAKNDMTHRQWRSLVQKMRAVQLERPLVHSTLVKIDGVLAAEIKRRYIDRSLKDVVSELVRIGLGPSDEPASR